MGITAMLRTLAAMAGPSFTGLLAENQQFWIAFVVAGACRLAYDLGLYVLFVNMKLYQNEGGAGNARPASPTAIGDDEMVELDDLLHSDDDHDHDSKSNSRKTDDDARSPDRNKRDSNLRPEIAGKVRRRSPSPLVKPP